MRQFTPATSSVRPPRPGEAVRFVCRKCGSGFSARLPLLGALARPRCPDCGSHSTERDARIVN